MEEPVTSRTPLQQELDDLFTQGKNLLGAELMQNLHHSVETLIISGAAEKALREGQQAPDFTLPDAIGRVVTLADILTRGPAVVIFYRGIWCPYCNLQLRAYQQMLPRLQALGASLVAISPQTPDHGLSQVERQELSFPVLSDRGNRVARAYGLVYTLDEITSAAHQQIGIDLSAYNGDTSWELPMPATFLIDQASVVRLAVVDPEFTHRPDPSLVIARLQAMPA